MASASSLAAGVARAEAGKSGRLTALHEWLVQPGVLTAMPITILLVFGFLAPLIVVFAFAFMPEKTFSIFQVPTLENFTSIFANSFYLSFLASLYMAAATTAVSLLVSYPIAYGMVRIFGRHASILALLITAPLFVADNLRLVGWMLFLVKGGVFSGALQTWLGIEVDSMLYTTSATLFGLVYTYVPFMLFPVIMGVAMVPLQMREAAFDLGATRFQVLKEVDVPLAMPGILIGVLMTFILAAGSLSEPRILGGSAVVMIAQDIQNEFTFAQNWPKGSALSVLMILLAGALAVTLLKRIDLDAIFGRK